MTLTQQIITIAMVVLGTVLTRFLPFIVFPQGKEAPAFVKYLGNVLPTAALAMLAVYCLKDVDFTGGSYGLPELIALAAVTAAHLWKRKLLLSIATGTVLYMILVQFVF